MTCNSRAGIDRYRYWNETFERKTICENDGVAENDEQPPMSSNAKKYSKSICHATTFHRLDQRTYLVGTGDGSVYTCTYDNLRCYSTKTIAHFGVIKSLDKSPYSPDVYLTTGCDCTVKIWMGDIFVEPVITLGADGQIEKAIWSRTNPTVIVSIVGNAYKYIRRTGIFRLQSSKIACHTVFIEFDELYMKCTTLETGKDV